LSISLKNCRQWYRKVYIPEKLKEVEKEDIEKEIENREKVLFVNLEEKA